VLSNLTITAHGYQTVLVRYDVDIYFCAIIKHLKLSLAVNLNACFSLPVVLSTLFPHQGLNLDTILVPWKNSTLTAKESI
jgi:hypothetical protein